MNGAATHDGPLTAILLAAGESSRMGRQKMLLPVAGVALVRHASLVARAARIDELLVVLGRDHAAVRAALTGISCTFVINARYRDGMQTSVRCGIDAAARSRAALLLLADQPFVTTPMLNALLARYEDGSPLAVFSQFAGTFAPPHLFDRVLFDALGGAGARGARGLARELGERCAIVEQPAEGLLDVDDEAGYERALVLAVERLRPSQESDA